MSDSRSRFIDRAGGTQNVLSSQPVFAAGDRGFENQIDFAIEDLFQLVAHLHRLGEAARGVGVDVEEDVDVALGVKVVAENRAKEREFGDVPFFAEFGDLLRR